MEQIVDDIKIKEPFELEKKKTGIPSGLQYLHSTSNHVNVFVIISSRKVYSENINGVV
jgi:hypothetical protein